MVGVRVASNAASYTRAPQNRELGVDFSLSEDQELFRKAIRDFCEREITPIAAEIDKADRFPDDLWKKLGDMGLLGIGVPESYGGSGGDMFDSFLAGEELAAASSGVALSSGAHAYLCVYNLFRNGSEAQRQRYLPELCAGRRVGALCITEPDIGSDAMGMTTRAEPDGDGFVLTGGKTWITNGPIADVFVLYAKTDPNAGARSLTAFILERGMPGLTTSAPFDKLGCKGSPTGRVFLDGVRVGPEQVLGRVGGGVHVLMSGLDVERALFSTLAIGQARRAFELALAYSQQRAQFGRPIAQFQMVQAKLADMYTRIEAARLLTQRATLACVDMNRGGKGTQVHKLAASALLFSAEAAEKVVYDALQIHGGNGYSAEFEISRLYRDVRLGTIGAGTSEIRRLIIARELLGS